MLCLQSTINPVDGVYQPSPLDASVVSAIAMPTQTTLPTGEFSFSPSPSLFIPLPLPSSLPLFSFPCLPPSLLPSLYCLICYCMSEELFLLFEPVDGAQMCKAEQRPSSLPVGPVVTVMGSLQTPTPNSTGTETNTTWLISRERKRE